MNQVGAPSGAQADGKRCEDVVLDFELEFVDQHLIHLRDDTGRWVILKRFRQSRPVPNLEGELLHVLLAHPAMRDYYFGLDSWPAAEPVHGPYWLDAVTPEVYKAVGAARAKEALITWVELFRSEATTPVEVDLSEAFRLLDQSPFIFELDRR